ncbi:MAG TPA: hypothetical protein VNB06_10570 [Thermoanaerobaculia bacterium]|nr:hypothetical protein [Thermoanaerobaculia bacterium]
MSPEPSLHALLIFSGTGPILLLSTFPGADDQRLVEKLRYKGIARFIAYEVSIDAVRLRYGHSFDRVVADLEGVEDARVLDYNGHQIMATFSRDELGAPLHIGE